jgi:hypothetical protein
MDDRWDTGWTLLPDAGGPRVHRPDPDRPEYAMCGRALDPGAPVHLSCPPSLDLCSACVLATDAARTANRAAVGKTAGEDAAGPPRSAKVSDPHDVDQLDRSRARGTSIRTVSGGLPTLGKRH